MTEFIEFGPDEFPVRIEAYDRTGTVVWAVTADSPGGLRIPSLRDQYGPVGMRMYCAGELREEHPPPSWDEIRDMQAKYGLDVDGREL